MVTGKFVKEGIHLNFKARPNCTQHVQHIGTKCTPPAGSCTLKPGYHPTRFLQMMSGAHLVQTAGGAHMDQIYRTCLTLLPFINSNPVLKIG